MKRIFILTILLVLGMWTEVAAQDAASLLQRGNQQYALYESEQEREGDPVAMYSYLLDSYQLFVKVLDTPNNQGQLKGAKNRLRAIYPKLFNGAAYFLQQNKPIKFLEFSTAYIELPKRREFQDELMQKDGQYPLILYRTAMGYHDLKNYDKSIRYFNEFMSLNVADELQLKNCYLCLNEAYTKLKNYAERERVLKQAIAKFPVTKDFLYHQFNLYIETKNQEGLSNTMDRILAIDPNDNNILPYKANLLRKQGKYKESLDLLKRLHTLHPDDFKILTDLARSYYAVGTDIVNNGRTITNQTEYAVVLQSAADYFLNAKTLFLQILEKKPMDFNYMRGLSEIYRYLLMDAEHNVLYAMLEEGASFTTFESRLKTYNEVHGKRPGDPIDPKIDPKPTKKPKLVIQIDENGFKDANGNKVIDAGERFDLHFTIRNEGEGDAYNLRLRLTEQHGLEDKFDGVKEQDGGHVLAGASKKYTFTYIAKTDLPTDEAMIQIFAFEQNGFDASAGLKVNTMEYAMPRLRIADYQFQALEGSAITLGSEGKFTLALQNAGSKAARNVKLKFRLPSNVFEQDALERTIDSISSGDVKKIDLGFLVNNRFDSDSISVLVDISSENAPLSRLSEAYKVKVGEYLASTMVTTIVSNVQNISKVVDTDYQLGVESELLQDVPQGKMQSHRYALIIGNEDYKSLTGANGEINVPYAVNDAWVFREYCVRTFGIPHQNIKVLANATTGMMREYLDWLINMANVDKDAELFFYYSGHGSPDESTKKAYLLPVDITGKNVRIGLALDELYERLGALSVKGAYVFLDACFSGSYKSADPLLAQKGVKADPNIRTPQGRMLSFSSSSGDQTSSVYHEKKQGYYTYFLLKVLQEAGGQISLSEWFRKTNEAVKTATAKLGKMQTPQAMSSPTWRGWENMQLMVP